jgi:hypothetical protein
VRNLVMWQDWWRWIGIELMVQQFKQRLLPLLLLAKHLNSVLELCKSCLLSVYMLPSGFGALGYGLPASDSLAKVLNLLVDTG